MELQQAEKAVIFKVCKTNHLTAFSACCNSITWIPSQVMELQQAEKGVIIFCIVRISIPACVSQNAPDFRFDIMLLLGGSSNNSEKTQNL